VETYPNFSSYLDIIIEISKSIDSKKLEALYERIDNSFNEKSRIFLAGNGGSAAVASHAATDLNNLNKKNKILNAISLSTNTPQLLANSNDYGYENVFINQIKNYKPNKNDTLIAISSSGNSENILNLIEYCKKMNTPTFSLLGFNGGEALSKSDYSLVVGSPKNYYGPVEDIHMMIFHLYAHLIKGDIRELN